ncbi:SRPBCC family protein [Brevundimonas sp. TWP2-3-4b1]|uniref:SRPBCC family protein n=1 Tax=Brevundimonas sp. TWP2-3-4b1 TaxID=2804580 RepID=UPI003CF64EA6
MTQSREMSENTAIRSIATQISIRCPVERAWTVLTTFEDYPIWNPYIVRIEGEACAGGRILTYAHVEGAADPVVQTIDLVSITPFTMRWQGGLNDRSLLFGDHWFELVAESEHTILFRHYEHFTGSRTDEILEAYGSRIEQSFGRFNDSFKLRCEADRDR